MLNTAVDLRLAEVQPPLESLDVMGNGKLTAMKGQCLWQITTEFSPCILVHPFRKLFISVLHDCVVSKILLYHNNPKSLDNILRFIRDYTENVNTKGLILYPLSQ